MSRVVIKAEQISKQYRLGVVGTGTVKDDFNRWWHSIRGKENPYLKIGEANDRSFKGESDYVWSLKDINFEINQGDSIGIIGQNGAGKSTLLKILSQVTQPTTGKIYTKGRIASLLEVGTGFHPEMTGRENIYLNGAILGMRKHEITRKFDEIVAFSGVERYIDTPVKRYSSGMYVRLAFAVAAHLESEILIVDEVLAVGDMEFQKKCLGKMNDVSKGEGRTVLFVSHNMLAVRSLCTKGILLINGEISKTGQMDDVAEAYLSVYTNSVSSHVAIEMESSGFIVHSISVTDNGLQGNFAIEDDLIIDIEITSLREFETININLFFNTVDGTTIFATCSPAVKQEKGKHNFKCVIPQKTLNNLIYNIDLMVVENGPKILHNIKNVITIEGIERFREGAWVEKFPGLIRPQNFKWNKIKTNE